MILNNYTCISGELHASSSVHSRDSIFQNHISKYLYNCMYISANPVVYTYVTNHKNKMQVPMADFHFLL